MGGLHLIQCINKKSSACIQDYQKIQNIGFGDDAINCSGINIYKTKLDSPKECKFNFTDGLIVDIKIEKEFRYQYSYTNKLFKRIIESLKFLKSWVIIFWLINFTQLKLA